MARGECDLTGKAVWLLSVCSLFFFFPIWSIFLLLHTHRHTHPHTGLHQLGKLNNRTEGGGGLQQKRDKLLRNPLPSFTITTYQ